MNADDQSSYNPELFIWKQTPLGTKPFENDMKINAIRSHKMQLDNEYKMA